MGTSSASSPNMSAMGTGTEHFSPQYLKSLWDFGSTGVTPSAYSSLLTALGKLNGSGFAVETAEWVATMEAVSRNLNCLHKLNDETSNEEDRDALARLLTSWTAFGLRKSTDEPGNEINETAVSLGCRLAYSLFTMPDIRFSRKLVEEGIVELLIDVTETNSMPVDVRVNAAEALWAVTYHSAVVREAFLSQPRSVLDEAPYLRITQITTDAKMMVLVKQFTALTINQCLLVTTLEELSTLAKSVSDGEAFAVEDVQKIVSEVKSLVKKRDQLERKEFFYRALHEGDILRSLCTLAAAEGVGESIRNVCVDLLLFIVHVDVQRAEGALFLLFSDSDVASLTMKIVSEAYVAFEPRNLLPSAVEALKLIDALAVVNQNGSSEIDSAERLALLERMFGLCTNGADDREAFVSAVCLSRHVTHLLEVLTVGTPFTPDTLAAKYFEYWHGKMKTKRFVKENLEISEEVVNRIRHSRSYFFLTEILLTVARLQSDGLFWMRNGLVICRLIENNLISSIVSLKYWVEPLITEEALRKDRDAVQHFLLSLSNRKEMKVGANDFFGGITALRHLDALLKGAYQRSVTSPCSVLFKQPDRYEPFQEIFSEFSRLSGMQIVADFIQHAVEDCLTATAQNGVLLPNDALIYSTLFSSGVSILKHATKSYLHAGKPFDVAAVGSLVRIYGLFCYGQLGENPELCDAIIEAMCVFCSLSWLTKKRSSSVQKLKCFLEMLIGEGQKYPFTFLAMAKLLVELIPYSKPYDELRESSDEISNAAQRASKEIWVEALCSLTSSFRFVFLMAASSTVTLWNCSTALCKRIAYIDVRTAAHVANILVDMSVQSLCEDWGCVLRDAVVHSAEEVSEACEVRLPAAADDVQLMVMTLLANCSGDRVLRSALISAFYRHPPHFRNVLHFFNVASSKTAAHVKFQAQSIVLFKNFCVCDTSVPLKLPQLEHEDFEKLCDSLVTHLANSDQHLQNGILSVRSLHEIADSSLYGLEKVRLAFSKSPTALLRFTRRLEAFEMPSYLLGIAVAGLAELLKSVLLKEPPMNGILQCAPANNQDTDAVDGLSLLNASLMAIVNRASICDEQNCAEAVILLSRLLPIVVTQPDSRTVGENSVVNAIEWPERCAASNAVDSALFRVSHFSAADILHDNPSNWSASAWRLKTHSEFNVFASLFDSCTSSVETDIKLLAEEYFQRTTNRQLLSLSDSFHLFSEANRTFSEDENNKLLRSGNRKRKHNL